MIKPIIYVVEGIHDLANLKRVDETIQGFVMHGSHFNQRHLKHLVKLSQTHRLILLLDPDGAGARIEKRIRQTLPDIEAIYVPQSLAIRADGKIGIEHMDRKVISTYIQKGPPARVTRETWTRDAMLEMQLMGHPKARIHRKIIAEKWAIPYTNAKQFKTILSRYAITKQQVKEGLYAA